MRVPVAPHPRQHLVVFVLDFSHSNRYVALSCFSCHFLKTHVVEHLFACYLPSSYLVRVVFSLLSCFGFGLVFLLLSFKDSLFILKTITL